MNTLQKASLFFLRVSFGWFFFYAGIIKVLNPAWSADGYLKGAKTFAGFYHFLLQPNIIPVVSFVNEWGLTLLGISLILGVCVRLSSILGALLMLLYYFPILVFPHPDANSFLVDIHIIYAGLLMFFASLGAGGTWGLYGWCKNLPLCSKFPKLRALLG